MTRMTLMMAAALFVCVLPSAPNAAGPDKRTTIDFIEDWVKTRSSCLSYAGSKTIKVKKGSSTRRVEVIQKNYENLHRIQIINGFIRIKHGYKTQYVDKINKKIVKTSHGTYDYKTLELKKLDPSKVTMKRNHNCVDITIRCTSKRDCGCRNEKKFTTSCDISDSMNITGMYIRYDKENYRLIRALKHLIKLHGGRSVPKGLFK